jgi:hypothetical protein
VGIVDFMVTWIDRLLSWLPANIVALAWFPVLFVVLVLVLRLVIRFGLPWLARVAEGVVTAIVALVALPVMLAIVGVAAPFRAVRRQPPTAVLAVDDAIVVGTTGSVAALAATVRAAAKLASIHIVVIVVLAGVAIWQWNAAHCAGGEAACVRPVTIWAQSVGFVDPVKPTAPAPHATTPSPRRGHR